jgi:hypothetical protein
MNKMWIPRILRAVTWISIPFFVISMVGAFLFPRIDQVNFPDWLKVFYPWVQFALESMAAVSFVLMITAYGFSFLFTSILNGLLRRYGQPATATIMARYNTGIRLGKVSRLWRIKLRVQPVGSEAFEAITENQGSAGNEGEQVPVKYDPFTKSTVILRPWDNQQQKPRDEKF